MDTFRVETENLSRFVILGGGESLLLAYFDKGMRILDLTTRAQREFAPGSVAQALALSPCGSVVAASYAEPEIHFRRVADGNLIGAVEGPRRLLLVNACSDLALSPDGLTLVSAWEDKQARIWALV